MGTDANKTSTTRGNEVDVLRNPGQQQRGLVTNAGLVQATTGDITLEGPLPVEQRGMLRGQRASVNTRGTVHLRDDAADDEGPAWRWAPGSVSGRRARRDSNDDRARRAARRR